MRCGFLALFVSVVTVGSISAQGEKKNTELRVTVVNVEVILDNYEKTRAIKSEIQQMLQQSELVGPNVPFPPGISKKQGDAIIAAWKEIQDAVRTYAEKHRIVIVLGHCDTADVAKRDLFPNINRKLQAMDLGAAVPLLASPRADITQDVLHALQQKETKAPVIGTGRVAVINIGRVFNGYRLAIRFKGELEESLEPYRKEAKKLTDNLATFQHDLRNDELDDNERRQLEIEVRKARDRLVAMEREIKTLFGRKQEEKLVRLWKDVQGAIDVFAKRNNIDLVLGYGDPIEKELLQGFDNVNRKMQALDQGSVQPLFFGTKVEIAEGVIRLLNQPDEELAENKITPFKVGVVNVGYVFSRYARAIAFKQEFARAPLDDRQRASVQRDNLVTLWRELQMGNKAIAEAYQYDLLLGLGEPLNKSEIEGYPNIRRKLKGMHDGAGSVLYAHPSIDLSDAVARTLNHWVEQLNPKVKKQPNDAK